MKETSNEVTKIWRKIFFAVLRSENCFPFSVYLDFSSVIRIIRLTSPEVEWKWTDKDQIKILFAIFKVAREIRFLDKRKLKNEKLLRLFFNRLTNLQSIFFYLRNFPLLSLHSPSVTMTSHVTQQECSLECRQMSSSTLNSLSVIGQIRTRSEKNGKFPHFSLSHEIARKKAKNF